MTSATQTVTEINQTISVSISGAGDPAFKINGGAEVTSGSVTWGNTLQLLADAPASARNMCAQ